MRPPTWTRPPATSIRVSTDSANAAFDAACASQQQDLTVASGSGSYRTSVFLYGCGAGSVTITVTLLEGSTTVASVTEAIDVVAGPSVRFFNLPADAAVGEEIYFSVSALNLDPAASYTVRVATDGPNLGVLNGCGTTLEDFEIVGEQSSTQGTTLTACAAPGGTVTVTLLSGGVTVHTVSHYVGVG